MSIDFSKFSIFDTLTNDIEQSGNCREKQEQEKADWSRGGMAAEYLPPTKCEVCGSSRIIIRAIFDTKIVRYICGDCGYARALPKIENLKRRTNSTLSRWAESVKTHNPSCKICGSKENLEAHHIIPVSRDSEYKYRYSNGITLCKKCHNLVHGRK